jgi:hypothetical protein
LKRAENHFVCGISGTGKSYYVGKLVEDLVVDDGFFCILLDPKFGEGGEYGDHKGLSEDLGFAHERIDSVFIDGLLESKDVEDKAQRLIESAKSKGFNGVRFTFESLDIDMTTDKMRQFAEKIARFGLMLDGKVLLVEEECHNFIPHTQRGGSVKDIKVQSKFIDEGRKINKRAILSTQKPTKANKDIYSLCQLYHVFFMGETLSDYTKVLPKDYRERYRDATSWDVESRNMILYNRNDSSLEVKNVDGLSRRTRHSG